MRKSKNAKNANAESYIDIMEKNHMEIPWHDYASADSNVLICKAGLIEKASVIGRVGLIMLSCGTGAWRVRTSMNRLSIYREVSSGRKLKLVPVVRVSASG